MQVSLKYCLLGMLSTVHVARFALPCNASGLLRLAKQVLHILLTGC